MGKYRHGNFKGKDELRKGKRKEGGVGDYLTHLVGAIRLFQHNKLEDVLKTIILGGEMVRSAFVYKVRFYFTNRQSLITHSNGIL